MAKPFLTPLLIGITLLLAACSTSPVVKLYEGADKPESELAIVRVPVELEVLSINGRRVEGVNSLFSPGYKDLHLAPGEYRILAYYKDLWDINADTHDVIKSDPAIFPVDARAGHFYQMGFDEPQSIEQARALEKAFSGYIIDTATGEKTPSRPSGVAFRSGLIGSLGDFAGVDTLTSAGAETSEQGNQVVQPLAAKNAGEGENPPSAADDEAGAASTANQFATDGGYLDMLKAYWSQATAEERREFLRWISEQK